MAHLKVRLFHRIIFGNMWTRGLGVLRKFPSGRDFLNLRSVTERNFSSVYICMRNKSLLNPVNSSVSLPKGIQKLSNANFTQVENRRTFSLKSSNFGNADKNENKWYGPKNSGKLGLAVLSLLGIISGGSLLFLYGPPRKDNDGNEVIDEFSNLPVWEAYVKRVLKELHAFKKMIQDPSSEKLLPDKREIDPTYTLVMEMTGVLVHPDWTLATGWRFKKRPGLDYFLLQAVSSGYEVVIYTHEQLQSALPILDNMDTNQCISYKLFRDSTRYVDGKHIKDLSSLNRDIRKVIILDCDAKAMSLQPENGFLLPKWTGDDSDRKLIDLASFLSMISTNNVDDVRSVLEHYAQFDDPIEAYKEKQKLIHDQRERKDKSQNGNLFASNRFLGQKK